MMPRMSGLDLAETRWIYVDLLPRLLDFEEAHKRPCARLATATVSGL
jgi:hypothetical protein